MGTVMRAMRIRWELPSGEVGAWEMCTERGLVTASAARRIASEFNRRAVSMGATLRMGSKAVGCACACGVPCPVHPGKASVESAWG